MHHRAALKAAELRLPALQSSQHRRASPLSSVGIRLKHQRDVAFAYAFGSLSVIISMSYRFMAWTVHYVYLYEMYNEAQMLSLITDATG